MPADGTARLAPASALGAWALAEQLTTAPRLAEAAKALVLAHVAELGDAVVGEATVEQLEALLADERLEDGAVHDVVAVRRAERRARQRKLRVAHKHPAHIGLHEARVHRRRRAARVERVVLAARRLVVGERPLPHVGRDARARRRRGPLCARDRGRGLAEVGYQ